MLFFNLDGWLRPRFRIVPCFVVVMALSLSALNAVAQPGGGPPPAPVVLATAEARELAPSAWYTGSVMSRNEARVPAEVDGRLVHVAEVGTRLREGEELARLDDTLMRLQVDEYQAEVQRVTARLEFLVREVDRLERLAQQNNAARTLLEETISERERSRSELAVAQSRFEQAKVRLERSVVRAPFAGIVSERLVRAGEWVDSGNAVARLIDPKSLEVVAKVPLEVATHVGEGARITVSANGDDVAASVRSLVPVGDAISRLVDLRLDFSYPAWSHGLVVRVAVPTAAARKVVAVPRDALVLRRAGAAVFRIDTDNVAQRVDVETGVAAGPFIEIVDGLQAGDRVVIRGGERLRSGQKVSEVGLGVETKP